MWLRGADLSDSVDVTRPLIPHEMLNGFYLLAQASRVQTDATAKEHVLQVSSLSSHWPAAKHSLMSPNVVSPLAAYVK